MIADWNSWRGRLRAASVALGAPLAALFALPAWAEYGLNMTRGVTSISREVYDLHMIIFWICVVIGVLVFGVMFYSVFAHRRSRHPKPADFHENTALEIAWTAIPFVILIAMAIPATKTLVDMEDASEADMTVQVTGYQWRWQYEYLDEDISFFSNLDAASRDAITGDPSSVDNYLLEVDNRLVLPVGKRVRMRFVLQGFEPHPSGGFLMTNECTAEVEGQARPAMVAEWLGIFFRKEDGSV